MGYAAWRRTVVGAAAVELELMPKATKLLRFTVLMPSERRRAIGIVAAVVAASPADPGERMRFSRTVALPMSLVRVVGLVRASLRRRCVGFVTLAPAPAAFRFGVNSYDPRVR